MPRRLSSKAAAWGSSCACPRIALSELDRLQVAGLRFGTVLADVGYSVSAAFRQRLEVRGLRWAIGAVRNQKVYDTAVQLVPPTGRARKPVPDQEPQDAEAVLAHLPWRRVTWRQGTKGKLSDRFATIRVRIGEGPVWTAPVLPMRPSQPERRTHDYRRQGTTDLFAALDVHAGRVIGRGARRHRSIEFRAFLNQVEATCRTISTCISCSTTRPPI